MTGAAVDRTRDAVADRLRGIDWRTLATSLDAQGFARLPAVLTADECRTLRDMYADESRFRSRIDMERFRFGLGEYKYFSAPLPPVVQTLRTELYQRLAPIANQGHGRLKPRGTHPTSSASLQASAAFPVTLDEFLVRCHKAGQRRPTPLLLSYREGGYNCLHQDIYGDLAFPIQVVFVLSRPGVDFTGGELLLVEQRPRAQSRGHAVAIEQGAGVAFATRERPAAGTRGSYRVVMRHGVSTITSGARMSLGIIFHDAR
jgi:hypothetical protein